MIATARATNGDEQQHAAWLASLSAEDSEIVHSPIGWRYTLVLAAETKRALLSDMPADMRLEFLERLASMSGGGISAEAITAIEPACTTAARMFHEADGSLDVLADFDVFREFARLNPSLRVALRLCGPGEAVIGTEVRQ